MVVSMMGYWSSPHTWPTALDQLCCFQLRINSFFHLFLFKLDPFRVPVLKASAINKKTFLKVVSLNLFLIILTLTQRFPFIFQSPVITFISFQLKFLHLFFSFLETSPCPLPSWHPLQCRVSSRAVITGWEDLRTEAVWPHLRFLWGQPWFLFVLS